MRSILDLRCKPPSSFGSVIVFLSICLRSSIDQYMIPAPYLIVAVAQVLMTMMTFPVLASD